MLVSINLIDGRCLKYVLNYLFSHNCIDVCVLCYSCDVMCREGGLFLWDRMLQYGAAKDTKVMLTELSGGPLQAHHFMNTV